MVSFRSLVFRMVEAEEEYVEQLNLLVSCFLRPFKMAASSKKPPSSHEDVNSIFLNSETLLFLHQIFLKGLSARMESWPTLVLGECRGRGEEGAAQHPRHARPRGTALRLGQSLSCFTMTAAKSRLFLPSIPAPVLRYPCTWDLLSLIVASALPCVLGGTHC